MKDGVGPLKRALLGGHRMGARGARRLTGLAALALLACSGSSSDTGADGGANRDAPDNDDGGAGDGRDAASESPAATCGTDGWLTYGHDGRRTFATDACITGPLSLAWSYTPMPAAGQTTNGVHHALATRDAVYLQWAGSDAKYVGTTAADRLSVAGARVWTYDSGTDANLGNWASLWMDRLVLNDDGIYMVDVASGKNLHTTGVDWWGQSIPGETELFLSNTSKSDGPGLFVAAMDTMAATTWRQNVQGTMCGQALSDRMGGIALDGTTLFYAPAYKSGSTTAPTFPSGVYAFDTGMMGKEKWRVASVPASAISAGGGLIYGVEGSGVLAARRQSDGGLAWSQPVAGAGAQAPVLAAGRTIVATGAGLAAFDATTGTPAWTTPLPGAAALPYTITITNGCGGSQPLGSPVATSVAAAVGSGTLVVTTSTELHVLSLVTGTETWHGAVAGATALHDPVLVGHTVYVVDSPRAGVAFGPGRLLAVSAM